MQSLNLPRTFTLREFFAENLRALEVLHGWKFSCILKGKEAPNMNTGPNFIHPHPPTPENTLLGGRIKAGGGGRIKFSCRPSPEICPTARNGGRGGGGAYIISSWNKGLGQRKYMGQGSGFVRGLVGTDPDHTLKSASPSPPQGQFRVSCCHPRRWLARSQASPAPFPFEGRQRVGARKGGFETPYRVPKWEIPFLGPKNWTFGGAPLIAI